MCYNFYERKVPMANYELSNRIYELRTQKGLSQKELGAILGVSNKAVSKWETCTAIPKTETLIKLAEVFGISTEELINGVCKDDSINSDRKIENQRDVSINTNEKSLREIKRYFLKVSIAFEIILSFIATIPVGIGSVFVFIGSMSDSNTMFDIADYIVNSSIIWSSIVTTLGCVVLGKYLTKKSGVSGDFNKYKFLYYVMPRSVISLISTFSTVVLFFGSDHIEDVSYWTSNILNVLLSFISTVLIILIMSFIMRISIESDYEKSKKALKTIAIIATLSVLAGYIIESFVDYMDFGVYNGITPMKDFLSLCCEIAIAWLVYSYKGNNPKREKIIYTVLPLISIWAPAFLYAFSRIVRYI